MNIDNEIIVLDIAGDVARLQLGVMAASSEITNIGFKQAGDYFVRTIIDDDDRIMVVQKLLSVGALFSAGPGWSPAELLDYYRDQNFIDGKFRVISWRNPEDFSISLR